MRGLLVGAILLTVYAFAFFAAHVNGKARREYYEKKEQAYWKAQLKLLQAEKKSNDQKMEELSGKLPPARNEQNNE